MSGLFSSLNATVLALGAHSRSIELAGKNLANVNNASYSRQRVVYGDRGTIVTPDGAESLGLEALGVEQLRDALVDRQVMREVSLRAAYETEQKAYQRAQAGLGQGISTSGSAGTSSGAGDNGIAAALDDLFNSFQSFAANPTDSGQRQTLLQNSTILIDRLRLADGRLAQVQADLGAQITGEVDNANRLLSTIADLNGQIGRFEVNNPGSAVDLRDQRQARLEELAALLPVEVRNTTGGQVQVVAQDSAGADVILVDLASVLAPVAFDGTQITAGTPAVALAISSGSMQGSLRARDGVVQTLRDNLDQLAAQLVTQVNGVYNPTGATGDFFTAAGTTAATIALAAGLTAANLKASDGGSAGDNTLALAVAQLANRQFSTAAGDPFDGTFSNFFATTVSDLGQALSGATARADDQSGIEKLVRTQRDGLSGVSLDEEMADLMKFQRAFQASARVYQTIDSLLDVVVNRLGN